MSVASASEAGSTDGEGDSKQRKNRVVFHVTAYNSQVEKILDVRLIQPGKDEVATLREVLLKGNQFSFCRNAYRPSFRVFRLLEGHLHQRYLGS